MTVHYFPLQVDPARYSKYLDASIVKRLVEHDVNFIRYHPCVETEGADRSGFYNAAGAIQFRSAQIELFCETVRDGLVNNGDLVFFSDLFMPGVEAVSWLAHLEDLGLRIRGLIHGGSMNERDLIRGAPGIWFSEQATLLNTEEAFVGSDYMRDAILSTSSISPFRIVKTGFLLDEELPYDGIKVGREPIVVFNGRLSPDKWPEMFARLARELEGEAEFVNCLERQLSKADYYQLLGRAKVVVSFALHETFGTAIQEAVALGCIPVVPDRLCYVEQFAPQYRYGNWAECVDRVRLALEGGLSVPPTVDCSGCIERWFDLNL